MDLQLGLRKSTEAGEQISWSDGDLCLRRARPSHSAHEQHQRNHRIWDTYVDVSYGDEEVKHLQDECIRVRSIAEHSGALEALEKLLFACEEALKENQGLFLVSD